MDKPVNNRYQQQGENRIKKYQTDYSLQQKPFKKGNNYIEKKFINDKYSSGKENKENLTYN